MIPEELERIETYCLEHSPHPVHIRNLAAGLREAWSERDTLQAELAAYEGTGDGWEPMDDTFWGSRRSVPVPADMAALGITFVELRIDYDEDTQSWWWGVFHDRKTVTYVATEKDGTIIRRPRAAMLAAEAWVVAAGWVL